MTDKQNSYEERFIPHCATCGHYREWHKCYHGDLARPCKAADVACASYTTDRASDPTYEDYVYPRGWRPGSLG